MGLDIANIAAGDLSDVGAVRRGASHARIGGETNLVVDDHVDGAVGGVVREVRQMEGLIYHPLTYRCTLTVYI